MARSIAIRVHQNDKPVDVQVFERDIIKIGRLATAHLRLDDPKVKRIHAVIDISADGKTVSLIDMTGEGTVVNGERVTRSPVKDGDEVLLGDTRLVLVLDAAAVAAANQDAAPAAPAAAGGDATPLSSSAPQEPAATAQSPAPGPAAPAPQTAAPAAAQPGLTPIASMPNALAPVAPIPVSTTPVPVPAPAAPWVAPPLPPIPEDPITPENRHLEIALRWGGDVVEVRRLRGVPSFVLGVAGKYDLFVPLDGVVAAETFELLRQAPGSTEWQLRFTSKMSGTVTREGETQPLRSSGAAADGDAFALTITDGMKVDLSIGYFTLEIRNVSKSKIIPIPPFLDTFFLNTVLVTLFSFVSLLSVVVLYPTGLDDDDDALLTNPSQFQTLILKPPPKDNSFLEKLKQKSAQKQAAKDDTGKAGTQKAKKTDKGRREVKAQKKEKPTDEQVVAAKLNQLFGSDGNAGISQLFGADSGGGELQALLGGISGATAANAYGTGGLSFRGSAPGGGGTGTLSMGTGKVGTRGRGSGEMGYGSSEGGIGQKTDREPVITQGTPVIYGSLDKEIIRRVVRENMAQIKYCYERELTRTPGLYGKVTMKWIINGNGKVSKASVAETQMKNKTVEDCMARRIRGWNFPKPKGGGIVVVTYPFVFKKSG